MKKSPPLLGIASLLTWLLCAGACGRITTEARGDGDDTLVGDGDTGDLGAGGTPTGDGDSGGLCGPGATQVCVGPGACAGAQVCSAEGTAWGPCDCGDGAGDGDGAGGTGTGGTGTGGGDLGGGGMGGGNVVDEDGGILFDGTGPWVDIASNSVGIQGAFFVLEDSIENGTPVDDGLVHSDLTPNEFGDRINPCVTGTIAPVTGPAGSECDPSGVDCEWSALWGGGIGLNLNQSGGEDSVPQAFNAKAAGITGFTFELSGDPGGATVRFKAKMAGSDADFCAVVKVGANSVNLADLKHNCYDPTLATQELDPTKLTQLHWQLVASAGTEYEVHNFCVDYLGYVQ